MNFKLVTTTGAAALALGAAGPVLAYQDSEAMEEAAEKMEEAAEAVEAAQEEAADAEEEAAEAAEAAVEAEEAKVKAEAAMAEASAAVAETGKRANVAPEGSPHFIPAPPEGKGQIVFYRSSAMGFAVGCTVNQGGKDDKVKITSIGSGKYVIVTADPGKQDYWTKSEAKDAITLLIEEGETQYVECRIKMGFMVGRPDLSPSSPEEFVEKGSKLKLVDDDDMGEGALRSTDIEALK